MLFLKIIIVFILRLTPLCKSAQLYTSSEQAAYLSFPCFKLCLPKNSITPLFFLFPKKFFKLFGGPVGAIAIFCKNTRNSVPLISSDKGFTPATSSTPIFKIIGA